MTRSSLLLISSLIGFSAGVKADPIRMTTELGTLLRSKVTFRLVRKTRDITGGKLTGSVDKKIPITWNYVPDTPVSIPYLRINLTGFRAQRGTTLLVERLGKLLPDPKTGRYSLNFPVLKKINTMSISVITDRGDLEDWKITVEPDLRQSTIFVDETCEDYLIRIRELDRPIRPNYLFIGCRPGSVPHQVSLDVYWQDIQKIKYLEKVVRVANSIVTLPLEHRQKSKNNLIGIAPKVIASVYEIEYTPVLPAPFEIWGGIATSRIRFTQSNFPSTYTQVAQGLVGRFWFKPDGTRLSIFARSFNTMWSYAERLENPAQTYDEFSFTSYLSAELRYRAFSRKGWTIEPFIGGWLYLMEVRSRNFGIQRIITPTLGLTTRYRLSSKDKFGLDLRYVPLLTFFSPVGLDLGKSYWEFELRYSRKIKRKHKLFGLVSWSYLRFTPDGLAENEANYFIFGVGYGW